jgi:hypothetical protein
MDGRYFQTEVPSQDVTLYAGELILTRNGGSIEGTGVVKLTWSPTQLIAFDMELGPAEQTIDWSEPGRLLLVGLGVQGERALIRGVEETESKSLIHGLLLGGIPSFGRSSDLDTVLFHVAGFLPLWHQPIKLECNGWAATLHNAPSAAGSVESGRYLQEEAGLGITHLGTLRRKDGSTFGAESTQEFMKQLGLLLSFARGAWCIPMLLIGLGADGQVQWQSWNTTRSGRQPRTMTWFHESMGGRLAAILPGLCTRKLDPVWSEAVELAIHWYVESLSGVQNVESSVVLSQVALERLACAHIVESRMNKKKLPKTKSITDQLRVLLNDLQVPTSLPNDAERGMARGEASPPLDGPATFVDMRNLVAHPRGGLLATPLFDRRQAKDLGLWYLELVLLALFGYQGQYRNRLLDNRSSVQSEVVPWAKT